MDFDDIAKQAQSLASGHESQITEGVEKAAELVKDKVGHDDQVDAAVDKIEGLFDKQ